MDSVPGTLIHTSIRLVCCLVLWCARSHLLIFIGVFSSHDVFLHSFDTATDRSADGRVETALCPLYLTGHPPRLRAGLPQWSCFWLPRRLATLPYGVAHSRRQAQSG